MAKKAKKAVKKTKKAKKVVRRGKRPERTQPGDERGVPETPWASPVPTPATEHDRAKQLFALTSLRDKGWGLFVAPIDGLDDAELKRTLDEARYALFYDEWEDANNAARDLSDVGGVKSVSVFRVKCKVHVSALFVEGKQVKA